jgi:acetyltransferase-like isoleucine patch superfamily enzyme
MKMRRWLVKLLRSPLTLTTMTYDRVIVPRWISLKGVKMGRGCRFNGLPIVRLAPGARITLGNNVTINSRFDSNEAGMPHPTIFASLTDDSQIDIGDGSGISGASIVARAGIRIGERVLVGAGACIWDTDFHPLDPAIRREHQTRGARSAPVVIEDEVFIGARAILLKGVTIGRGAVIGAAALVAKDIAPGVIVAGNPARVIGSVIERQQERVSYENAGA